MPCGPAFELIQADVRQGAFRVKQTTRQTTFEDAQLFQSKDVEGNLGGFQRH